LRVVDATSGEEARFSFSRPIPESVAGWSAYPAAVARRLVRDFGVRGGLDLAFASDLPPAAGVSSSTALCVGVFLALWETNRLGGHPAALAVVPDLFHLADYLGAVENGRPFGPFPGDAGVGTLGGSQDQAAILCAIPGELVQFSFVPVRFERRIPFPAGHLLVVGSSGIVAEKSGAARASYNAASQATVEILQRWHEAGHPERSLAGAVTSSADAREELLGLVAGEPVLEARLRQFMVESEELVPQAGDALLAGDLEAFGAVVDRSHGGANAGLRNQTPETLHLAASARGLGAVAASAFGAGFGGSVWAMVTEAGAPEFVAEWEASYLGRFPERRGQARFLLTGSGPPALRLDVT
jgi:galactokinase